LAIILIVEDDVFTGLAAELMVGDLGHGTFLASASDEAISHLRSSQQIDVLFTDIRLKTAVVGGCELAHQAIKLRPGLRVLYTSGSFKTDVMSAMFVEGGCFLQKPYSMPQLQGSMNALLAASF
jgi:DNA-binding NtrC family response regulator